MPRTPDVVRHALIIPGSGTSTESHRGFGQRLRKDGGINASVHVLTGSALGRTADLFRLVDHAAALSDQVVLIGTGDAGKVVSDVDQLNAKVNKTVLVSSPTVSSHALRLVGETAEEYKPESHASNSRALTIFPSTADATRYYVPGAKVFRRNGPMVTTDGIYEMLGDDQVLTEIVSFMRN